MRCWTRSCACCQRRQLLGEPARTNLARTSSSLHDDVDVSIPRNQPCGLAKTSLCPVALNRVANVLRGDSGHARAITIVSWANPDHDVLPDDLVTGPSGGTHIAGATQARRWGKAHAESLARPLPRRFFTMLRP